MSFLLASFRKKTCLIKLFLCECTFLTKSQAAALVTVTNTLLCHLFVYMSNLSVSCRLSAACCLRTATVLTTSREARLPNCQVNSHVLSLPTQLHVRSLVTPSNSPSQYHNYLYIIIFAMHYFIYGLHKYGLHT